MRSALKILVVLALLLVVAACYFRKQDQVNVAGGKGWDGVAYHKMYLHYKGAHSEPSYEAPFNKRIGLPWLAAQSPLEPATAFRTINILSGLAACMFTYFALRPRFGGGVVLACMLPMAFFIFSPIRFPNFYPFTVDPPAMMLCALATLLFSRKHFVTAGVVLVASALFRESGIYFALALGAALAFSDRRNRRAAFIICLIAVVGAVSTTMLHLPGGEYSQFRTVLSSMRHKILDPLGLLRATVCIFMTLAPFLICKSRAISAPPAEVDELRMIGRTFLLLCVVMALLGGSDTTRIFFIGYPLYALLLADWIGGADALTVVLASSAGMIANRFCEMIPQPGATSPGHDVSGLFSITPDYAHPGVVAAFAAFWFSCWILLAGPARPLVDRLVCLVSRKASCSSR
jgi:hypothetical protein